MIAEIDIRNCETVTKKYRELETNLAYQEEKLKYFKAYSKSLNCSFNLHHRIDAPDAENLAYTLEADEMLPMIEAKILILRKKLTNLQFPRTNSCTTIEE